MSAKDLPEGEVRSREDTTEEHSFDELAKGMASGTISRGQALKLVGATILGGTLVGLFPGVAEARHHHHHRRHGSVGGAPPSTCGPPPKMMCGTVCVDTSSDPNNCGVCGKVCSSTHGTASCKSGTCEIVCSPGFGNCNGNPADGCETDTQSDPTNCGACGNVCPAAAPNCSNGVCSA